MKNLPQKKAIAVQMKPKSILMGLSALVMFVLLVIPGWNAIALLRDPVFMYMVGYQTTGYFLGCCVLLFVISYISVSVFLNRVQPKLQTQRTMLMVSGTFLAALGIMLFLFGRPIERGARDASKQFMQDCKNGLQTQKLYFASVKLQSLRASPTCAKLASIEDCHGFNTPAFEEMNEAKVLQYMETSFQCSGICAGTNEKGEQVYPPTLFSQANYKLSCDGMAARRLLNFDAELASQMVTEGTAVLVVAVLISFVQLIGICSSAGKSQEGMSGKSYGATL